MQSHSVTSADDRRFGSVAADAAAVAASVHRSRVKRNEEGSWDADCCCWRGYWAQNHRLASRTVQSAAQRTNQLDTASFLHSAQCSPCCRFTTWKLIVAGINDGRDDMRDLTIT